MLLEDMQDSVTDKMTHLPDTQLDDTAVSRMLTLTRRLAIKVQQTLII